MIGLVVIVGLVAAVGISGVRLFRAGGGKALASWSAAVTATTGASALAAYVIFDAIDRQFRDPNFDGDLMLALLLAWAMFVVTAGILAVTAAVAKSPTIVDVAGAVLVVLVVLAAIVAMATEMNMKLSGQTFGLALALPSLAALAVQWLGAHIYVGQRLRMVPQSLRPAHG